MPRQVDFGDDVDVALGGVLDEVAKLVLGVETAVANGVVQIPIMPDDRAIAIRANLRQFWIFLDFDAPTLVFTEVEMELVHVVHGHHIQVNLHRVQRDEVAAGVEVHSAIGEVRKVADSAAR